MKFADLKKNLRSFLNLNLKPVELNDHGVITAVGGEDEAKSN
jgi:hypothetical protein